MGTSDELASIFAKITDTQTMNTFFKEIFTTAELKDFILRWELMKMLKQAKNVISEETE